LILDFWNTVNTELKTTGIPQSPSAPDPAKPNVINPDGITQMRWVVAHVPFITPSYIELSKNLGVGLSVLGGWRWLSGTPTANGPPFRTILDMGARAGMSSDGMQIAVMDPWTGMYYAVTGKNARGVVINGNQTISREQVLRLYTADNAWFLGPAWEKKLGTIEKGKWADLVVLNADYFDPQQVPDEQIMDIRSVMTIVNGRVVHDQLSR
jgi:predicted amidohydrolase YtcJ